MKHLQTTRGHYTWKFFQAPGTHQLHHEWQGQLNPPEQICLKKTFPDDVIFKMQLPV
jgi:hypothetical protein